MASSTASEPSPEPSPELASLPQAASDFERSSITTLVSWELTDGTTEYLQAARGGSSSTLCRPKMHVCYESASHSALFKLQLSVLLKAQRNKSKNTAQFFILIPPENIMSFLGGQEQPEIVQKTMPADTVCLRFALSAPPIVVAPPAPERLVPKNEHSAGVLASLQDLARQTNIAIYLSHRVLDQSRLRELCTAASSRGLGPVDRNSITTLYGGKGGRTLEASIIATPAETDTLDTIGPPATDIPPSYDELDPKPPSLLPEAAADVLATGSSPSRSSRKRPRRSSSDAGSRSPSSGCGGEGTAKKHHVGEAAREARYDVDTMEKQTEQSQEIDRRIGLMEQRLTARLDARLDRFEQQIKEQVEEHRRSITEMVEERMEAHEEQTQSVLDYLRREVESDVEEQLLTKKAELDDEFKDERGVLLADLEERFADLEDSIVQRFSSARAVLEFD